MIPKIFHFIWLTPPDGKPFNFHHMAAIWSAHIYNRDYKIFFHCDQVPDNKYFDVIRELVEVKSVQIPDQVFGIPIKYMVMKADVLRLEILKMMGGVYLDLDVLTLRSYDDLISNNRLCLGLELSPKLRIRQIIYFLRTFQWDVIKYKGRVPAGLCAGVIMTCAENEFIKDWYDAYKDFNNDDWAYLPVKHPWLMFKTGKYSVHVIPPYLSHFPSSWSEDLKLIFEESIQIEGKYFLHTWESRSYENYLSNINESNFKSINCTYTDYLKKMDLPI